MAIFTKIILLHPPHSLQITLQTICDAISILGHPATLRPHLAGFSYWSCMVETVACFNETWVNQHDC